MTANVSKCIIYPIKAAKGVEAEEGRVGVTGLSGDRDFMLVDESNRYLNQKQLPQLATISLDQMTRMMPLRLTNAMTDVKVHNDTVKAFSFHDETNASLSTIFGRAVKLVMFPMSQKRPLDPLYSLPDDNTHFADEFPILITSESSLDALAPYFKSAVTMDRFRPNIVVRGTAPFAEDTWKRIKIGSNVELEVVQDCARCAITTVNQQTGEKSADAEPLSTLNEFRKGDKKVFFGVYAIPRKTGPIRVGDTVEVLEERPLSSNVHLAKINGLRI